MCSTRGLFDSIACLIRGPFFHRHRVSVTEPLSRPGALRSSALPGDLFTLILLVLIHLLVQALRHWLAPGFPGGGPSTVVPGVIVESLVAWGLLRVALDYAPRAQWFWSGAARTFAGIAAAVGTGMAFFLVLILLDRLVLHLPEHRVVGTSFAKQALLVPAIEEVYFRLLLTGALLQRQWKPSAAVVTTAVIFALSHDYFVAPFLFPVGLAAGWLFRRYGLIAAFVMHATYNGLILLVTAL